MGYMMTNGTLNIGDSDTASDFASDVEIAIIRMLKKQMKVKEHPFNTDGIVNVAMFIVENVIASKYYNRYGLAFKDFARDTFLPAYKKYIEKITKEEWDSECNKSEHIIAFRNHYVAIEIWTEER